MSISKLSQNDVGTLEYSGRSRRTEDGVDDVDWSTRDGSVKMEYELDAMADEDSPYPEVRASVSNVDDPEMPTLTFRMWLVGLLLVTFSAAFNVVFNFRSPAPSIIPLVILLVTYPFGKFAAYILPIRTYSIPFPKRLGGPCEVSLNPGPFNIKEHALIFMMSNIAVGPPYALNATIVGSFFYNIRLGPWFELLLVLSTQLTGMGLAGMCRRLLVYPASMVWPNYLVLCTLLNTLHAEDDDMSGGITRYRFFTYVAGGAFLFYFLPGYLFRALGFFSWICWIKPNNVLVNQLFGFNSGMGLSTITFDWTQITWIGSPLMTPWWAEVHVFIGFTIFFWIVTPALYYSNSWNLSYFPMAASFPYDRMGEQYNVSRILTSDNRFNQTAFDEYSPLFLPATYAVTYVLALTLFSCSMVHTILYHGHSVWKGLQRKQIEPPDIHMKLMQAYKEVPDWWYLAIFAVFFSLAIVAVEVWHTSIPIWALGLAVLLPVIYCIPSGYLYAMTGDSITLNLPAQIIPGVLLPGNPLANMVFKAVSLQTLIVAGTFTGDMKLGHYIKVPPRATFLVQSITTIICAFVQVGVKEWMFANIEGICEQNQKSRFICPHNDVFYTASAIWGLIGPARQFGDKSPYHPQLYALIAGALLPIPFYLWQRRYPKTRLKYINIPIMLNGCQYIPPATGINYSSWFFVAWIFQYQVRRRNFAWWSKFNYVASAAMDSGTTIALLVIFFTLQFPKGGISLNWWGNDVFANTADWNSAAFRTVPLGGIPGTEPIGLPAAP
ncbi:hypothetical protein M422DRAFT_158620 [Sphaerobolus stellatus SS14]|nr:hypothetical protein M422DRAFT_158620 [Sphaerobolus stellatus SS14]